MEHPMAAEIWDLYDASGRRTGRTMLRGEEVPQGMYHLVIHIWPINSRGEFLIQRRAMSVQWKPGLWAVTGGSAITGEDAMTAARRELLEELGYDAKENEIKRIACLRRSNSFCNVFTIKLDCPEESFVLQEEEVSEVKWCDGNKLLRMVEDNMLYNYGDAYFRMLLHYQRTHP
ncbi:MAG: NUDIX domain-containing protein [Clostridiales bacterium]|nr:NUDIX domain-containing protein [Clostridiales bacterium]